MTVWGGLHGASVCILTGASGTVAGWASRPVSTSRFVVRSALRAPRSAGSALPTGVWPILVSARPWPASHLRLLTTPTTPIAYDY